jgi:microcystin-dependent protein
MTEPYVGQIEIYGFYFAPARWAFAAGQLVPVQQNTALFSLIGSTYGGDGTRTFQLPNLASRQACGSGQGPGVTQRRVGDTFGDFAVSLTVDQMPGHNHGMNIFISAPNPTAIPDANSTISVPGATSGHSMYAVPGAAATMAPTMVLPTGSNVPHDNVQPYLALNYCIALSGEFPSWN